jgi:hypothetical protein
MAGNSDLLDLTMQLHAETNGAILVSDDGDKAGAVWLPKSQIEYEVRERGSGAALVEVTMPEWLALDKGLI